MKGAKMNDTEKALNLIIPYVAYSWSNGNGRASGLAKHHNYNNIHCDIYSDGTIEIAHTIDDDGFITKNFTVEAEASQYLAEVFNGVIPA